MEVYNEKIQDLLEPRAIELPVIEDQYRNLFVCGLPEKIVESVDEFNASFAHVFYTTAQKIVKTLLLITNFNNKRNSEQNLKM